jgi:hypothetical protein
MAINRLAATILTCWILGSGFVRSEDFALHDGDTVVFLGDSPVGGPSFTSWRIACRCASVACSV